MLAEMTIRGSFGEFVLHVNGGYLTVRRLSEKPYQARKIETSEPVWDMLYKHFHAIEDIVNAAPFDH